ncbi:pilus assembly protein TadG-related protein [Lederbergia panacisoli]|uniref:pilus assembly protein TadG-related protein n=1 Tax=Lederbergia panacisoli TaxID=1255251 RepID=UPI00214CC2FB|nr:pilus assembly protein TadG-related protein [Lederbergia panacisoli]MCR2823184.1 pilus assembly protein TadG-related protein [Lederbergia panacisoli]
MKFLKRLVTNEDGNIVLMSTFLFLALTAFAGLVVDGGHLYLTKAHLQKAANAAALSGGQELTSDQESKVKSLVENIVDAHGESLSLKNVEIEMEKKVSVNLTKSVDLFFSSIFGMQAVNVSTKATAQIGSMGRAYGAAPIGINDSVQLNFGEEYTLKVDETGGETGFFGILGLQGPGAKLYEQNLMHGFDGELKVGDIVNTESGNIAGPTQRAVDYLVKTCNDMNAKDCPRILLIPVYKPYNVDGNKMKEVKITGFAHFYISEPMNDNDKTIKGIFLKRVTTGFETEDALNKGAYSLKLVE